jgi:hypothetical protein
MKVSQSILLATTALLLAVATAARADQPMPQGHQEMHQHTMMASHHNMMTTTNERMTGTIVSLTPTKLVLATDDQGKKVETSFVLDPETHREGTLKSGATVTVSFRTEAKERIATRVKVETPKEADKSAQSSKN